MTKANPLKNKYSLFLLVVLSLLLILPLSTSGSEEAPEKPVQREDHNPKIETNLQVLAEGGGDPATARAATNWEGKGARESPTLEVVLEEEAGQHVDSTSIKKVGGRVLGRAEGLVKVRIPAGRLEELVEEVRGIRYVRSPLTPVSLGNDQGTSAEKYTVTGVNLTGGSVYHANNYMGQDVKVAVIDVGFASYDLAVDAGELPQEYVADREDYTGYGFQSGEAHGTAVAEIVHDMAPRAKLFLKKINDEVSLANAVGDAVDQGIDVIVHSVGWMNTNFSDGTGVIADVTREATGNGILWVNAAGNSARRHWEGEAEDGDGDGWVEFAAGKESLTVEVPTVTNVQICLTWDDWPESDLDFDLFLYDDVGNMVASSQNHQTGTQPPAETVTYTPTSTGEYYLKVRAADGTVGGAELEIFSTNNDLTPYVASGSIMAPGNAEEVFTVGAINETEWKEGPIEPFSSRGPTSDGRVKPDLTGVDGFETYTYISFLGTSAAAPIVGGAGALILSRSPELDAGELKEALSSHAQDLGLTGRDNTYGEGKMRLIFASPSVSRTVEPGGSASPGETFTVNLEAKMPLTLQGGIAVEEELPEGFAASEATSAGESEADGNSVRFDWGVVGAGNAREASYEVSVPEDAPSGDYEITGKVNGTSFEATSVTVEPGSSSTSGRELELEGTASGMDGSDLVKFVADGENIEEIRVVVYALSGDEVYDSGWRSGNTFQWNLMNDDGGSVQNGLYLYLVRVKGSDGEVLQGEIEKTLVLR